MYYIIIGSTGAIKLYLNELIALLSTLLKSPSWPTKKQSALAMANIAKSIGFYLS
jgi:hypothetical protein